MGKITRDGEYYYNKFKYLQDISGNIRMLDDNIKNSSSLDFIAEEQKKKHEHKGEYYKICNSIKEEIKNELIKDRIGTMTMFNKEDNMKLGMLLNRIYSVRKKDIYKDEELVYFLCNYEYLDNLNVDYLKLPADFKEELYLKKITNLFNSLVLFDTILKDRYTPIEKNKYVSQVFKELCSLKISDEKTKSLFKTFLINNEGDMLQLRKYFKTIKKHLVVLSKPSKDWELHMELFDLLYAIVYLLDFSSDERDKQFKKEIFSFIKTMFVYNLMLTQSTTNRQTFSMIDILSSYDIVDLKSLKETVSDVRGDLFSYTVDINLEDIGLVSRITHKNNCLHKDSTEYSTVRITNDYLFPLFNEFKRINPKDYSLISEEILITNLFSNPIGYEFIMKESFKENFDFYIKSLSRDFNFSEYEIYKQLCSLVVLFEYVLKKYCNIVTGENFEYSIEKILKNLADSKNNKVDSQIYLLNNEDFNNAIGGYLVREHGYELRNGLLHSYLALKGTEIIENTDIYNECFILLLILIADII